MVAKVVKISETIAMFLVNYLVWENIDGTIWAPALPRVSNN